jgi:hypothetical protein
MNTNDKLILTYLDGHQEEIDLNGETAIRCGEDGHSVLKNYKEIVSVIVPDTVKNIEESAFAECENLINIKLPNSLECISEYAFNLCENLTQINIPDNVMFIKKGAFCDCKRLMYVNLSSKLTEIDDFVFYGCTSLIEITLPDNITYIGDQSFAYCSNLRRIIFPVSLKDFDGQAFDESDNVTIYCPAASRSNYCLIDWLEDYHNVKYILNPKNKYIFYNKHDIDTCDETDYDYIYENGWILIDDVENASIEELRENNILQEVLNFTVLALVEQGVKNTSRFVLKEDNIVKNILNYTDWKFCNKEQDVNWVIFNRNTTSKFNHSKKLKFKQKVKLFDSTYIIEINENEYITICTQKIMCAFKKRNDIINEYLDAYSFLLDKIMSYLSWLYSDEIVEYNVVKDLKYGKITYTSHRGSEVQGREFTHVVKIDRNSVNDNEENILIYKCVIKKIPGVYYDGTIPQAKFEDLYIRDLCYKKYLYDVLKLKIKDMIGQGSVVRSAVIDGLDNIIGDTDWVFCKDDSKDDFIVLTQSNKWFESFYIIEANTGEYDYVCTQVIRCPENYELNFFDKQIKSFSYHKKYDDDIADTYFKTFFYIIEESFSILNEKFSKGTVKKLDNEDFKYARIIHRIDSIHEDVYMMRAEKEQPYNKQMTLLFQHTRKTI